jgi:DNA-binding CsgD family transcriptional regulator
MNREFPAPAAPAAGYPSLPGAAARAAKPPIHLTPRETEIVRFVMLGESNKQIARRLGISNYTVRDHVSNLLKKAAVSSRSRLALVFAAPLVHAAHEPAPHLRSDPPLPRTPDTRPHGLPDACLDLGAVWRTTR